MASANGQAVTTCHWANCQNVYVMAPCPLPQLPDQGSDGNAPDAADARRDGRCRGQGCQVHEVHVHVGPVVGKPFNNFNSDKKEKQNQDEDGHVTKRHKANHEKKDHTYYMPTSVRQALRFEAFYRRSAVASLSDRITNLQEQVNQLESLLQGVQEQPEYDCCDVDEHTRHYSLRWNPYVHGPDSPSNRLTHATRQPTRRTTPRHGLLDPLPPKSEEEAAEEVEESPPELSYLASSESELENREPETVRSRLRRSSATFFK